MTHEHELIEAELAAHRAAEIRRAELLAQPTLAPTGWIKAGEIDFPIFTIFAMKQNDEYSVPVWVTDKQPHTAVSGRCDWPEIRRLKALLRDALPHVAASAEASHFTDGFRRKPDNALDNLAHRIRAEVLTAND